MQLTFPYRDGLPGRKEQRASVEAARRIAGHAITLQNLILECLRLNGSLTTDECAAKLSQTVLAVRPRFSELQKLGLIEKTKERRKNISGMSAAVWRLVDDTPSET